MSKKTELESPTFGVNIKFTPTTMRAIQTMAKKHFRMPCPVDCCPEALIALHAVQFALTSPTSFSEFIYALQKYEKDEGLNPIVHAGQLVANHPEYAKKRLSKKWLPRLA